MLCALFCLASLAFTGVISQDTDAACTGGFTAYRNYCYAYIDHPQSWPDAQSTCSSLGGFLAEVYSNEENEYLKKMVNDHGGHTIWIGGDDLIEEGKWYWSKSGALISEYSDWASGQPDNGGDENCIEMNQHSFGGHWNDDHCEHKQRFVCQKYHDSSVIG